MTITITLPPEVEAAVRKQAEARGERVEELALNLVEKGLHTLPVSPPPTTLEEFERDWDELFTPIEGLPEYPPCAYTREDIYFDHD
jgi:hypothetical protein